MTRYSRGWVKKDEREISRQVEEVVDGGNQGRYGRVCRVVEIWLAIERDGGEENE